MTPFQITVDCADPIRMARFWAESLGYGLQSPPGQFDSWRDYWISVGVPEDEVEDGVMRSSTPTKRDLVCGSSRFPNESPSRTACISLCWLEADAPYLLVTERSGSWSKSPDLLNSALPKSG